MVLSSPSSSSVSRSTLALQAGTTRSGAQKWRQVEGKWVRAWIILCNLYVSIANIWVRFNCFMVFMKFFKTNLLKHDLQIKRWAFLAPSYGKNDKNYGNWGTGGGHCDNTDNFSEIMSCFQALLSLSQYSLIITRSLCALLRCALSTELCTRQRPELTRSSEHGILSYALSGVWMRVARDIITFITWRQAMSGKCPRYNLLTNLALRYTETTDKFIVLKNKSECVY